MTRRHGRRLALGTAAVAAVLTAVGLPLAQSQATAGDARACSDELAGPATMAFEERRACVIAVASTYLAGEEGTLPPGDVLLDDEVARYRLGSQPDHGPDGAERLRAGWAGDAGVPEISSPEWTVDGDDAFVAYRVHADRGGPVARAVAARITLRAGLVWEVLENPTTSASAEEQRSTRTPFHEVAAVAGPMFGPVDMSRPDYDDPAWCSLHLGEAGDIGLSPDEERRCLIAIAATYVDAEGNETADSLTLFDPRFSKHSLGQPANHHPGNGDTNRMDQVALSPTIRLIRNKQWTADPTTGQVWIVYDGYLPVSTDKPGFYVAERFTIRDGLIWEIVISPVVVDVPNSLVPAGPPEV